MCTALLIEVADHNVTVAIKFTNLVNLTGFPILCWHCERGTAGEGGAKFVAALCFIEITTRSTFRYMKKLIYRYTSKTTVHPKSYWILRGDRHGL